MNFHRPPLRAAKSNLHAAISAFRDASGSFDADRADAMLALLVIGEGNGELASDASHSEVAVYASEVRAAHDICAKFLASAVWQIEGSRYPAHADSEGYASSMEDMRSDFIPDADAVHDVECGDRENAHVDRACGK